MTEACSTTNCTMMEVGGATNSMMKVCRATKTKNLYFYGNRYETVYLMMRQNYYIELTDAFGATSRMMTEVCGGTSCARRR